MMQTTQITKSNLAKLLATENINVEYRKTDTASFNVATRTLVLPLLNDMTGDMEDLFIGHEVGHAIDTPTDYGSVQADMPKGFKTFLNVVEDARIERRIKDRYPGLKKSFNVGYKEFMNRDFFQVKTKDVNRLLLIDRINLYFKIGPFFTVDFTPEEQTLVKKVSSCETFDDVVAVCKELYDYCKEELEQKREEAMQEFKEKLAAGEFDDEMEMDDFDDPFQDQNDEGQSLNPNMAESDFDEDDFDDSTEGRGYRSEEPQFEDHQPKELKEYDEVKSSTDENLEKALRSMAEQKEIHNGPLSGCEECVNYAKLIVPFKDLVGKVFLENHEDYKNDMLIEFEKKTKNSVSYLVKEFEMRKKAAELRRVVVSDTGVIDTNKLHTYKFNDNIFRKVGSVAAGKNHGIVMFVDWSGSMCDNMQGTIEQLITLTTFCRKVNVPFEVYAFSTEYIKRDIQIDENGFRKRVTPFGEKTGDINFGEQFVLLNMFSSRMKNQEYRRMANDLLNYGEFLLDYFKRNSPAMNPNMGLGGTPLNATIYAASGIVNRFRKSHKAEIVDVVFLTDGDDSSSLFTKGEDYYSSVRIAAPTRHSVSYIQDKQTQKRYRIGDNGVTPVLLQILKDRTGCNLIGFYILPATKRYFSEAMRRFGMFVPDSDFKSFKNEKFYSIPNYGYNQYFLIPGGKELNVEDEDLDDLLGNDNKEVSTRKLRGAFLKMNQNRLTNRVLLSKVIEELA